MLNEEPCLLSLSGQTISLKLKSPKTWTEGGLFPLCNILTFSCWFLNNSKFLYLTIRRSIPQTSLKKLKWESLQKRRKDNRIILLYKGLKGRAKIPTDDLIPKNRRCRNQHSLAFQIPSASTNAYLHSFFPPDY